MLHLHSPIISAIPKVVIDPPRPGKPPPNHHNHIPDLDHRSILTVLPTLPPKRPVTAVPKLPTTTMTKAPLLSGRVTPPPRRPAVPTRKPFIPTRKPMLKPYIPPKPVAPTRRPPPPPPPPVTPVDNSIQREVTKQRGDVHSKSETPISFSQTADGNFA